MTSPAEKFTFTQQIACADADGIPIREGSVLKEIQDGERGVVTRIVRAGDSVAPMAACIGDIVISISKHPTTKRVTNRYSKWRHIPHDEQTYQERHLSWAQKPFKPDLDRSISSDEQIAVNGIMSLLPESVVNWENSPWPDRLDDALNFLCCHLTSLKEAA